MRAPLPLLVLTALGLITTGCAVGPNYRTPVAPADASGPFVSATGPATTADAPPADWWRLYQDPVLDKLVQQALVENTDLKVAAANLAYAQALTSEARAGLFPTTTLSAGTPYGKTAPATKAELTYEAGFVAAYQVDLFGRIRRGIEAAKANAQAAQAAENAVRVTVAAETAGAYANACAYGEEAQVARRSLDMTQQAYDILIKQRTLGSVSDLDVAREATLLDQARAAVPGLEGQRRAALFELAVLTGKPPADISAEAAGCVAPPRLSQAIPVGDGAALLRRRPDVRESERQLAAATARIGVAAADLFPTVSLGGSVGSAAPNTSGLGRSASISYSIGPLITWSFPNILVARAHVKESSAQASAALATFDGTVLTALKETEQALTTYQAELQRHDALASAQGHAAEAYRLAQNQYRLGAISFLDLLTAEATLINAEQALASSDQLLSADQVAVFQALGGGWQDAPKVTPPKAG
jgi:NodT family efflux transporter outer membrane factor (OMF) lipoprotein